MKGLRPYPFKKIGFTFVKVSLIAGSMALGINSAKCKQGLANCKDKDQLSRDFQRTLPEGLRPSSIVDLVEVPFINIEGERIPQMQELSLLNTHLSLYSGLSPPLFS